MANGGWWEWLSNYDGTISLFLRSIHVYSWMYGRMFGRRPPRFVEFIADEEERKLKYPFSQTFKPDDEVHGAWLTGAGVMSPHGDFLRRHNILRSLVLPHPDHPSLTELAASFGSRADYFNLGSNIRTTTMEAKANGTDVRWYGGGFIGTNITIWNPERDMGAASLAIRLPYVEPGKIYEMRLEKRRNETEFRRLWDWYRKYLDKSDKVTGTPGT